MFVCLFFYIFFFIHLFFCHLVQLSIVIRTTGRYCSRRVNEGIPADVSCLYFLTQVAGFKLKRTMWLFKKLILKLSLLIAVAKYSNDAAQQGRTESKQRRPWQPLYGPCVTLEHSLQPDGISCMLAFLLQLYNSSVTIRHMRHSRLKPSYLLWFALIPNTREHPRTDSQTTHEWRFVLKCTCLTRPCE